MFFESNCDCCPNFAIRKWGAAFAADELNPL
jgi:hypothetical protein